jgi:ABC-2 type transport system ATP-binding protein
MVGAALYSGGRFSLLESEMIEFSNVSFSYEQDEAILKQADFEIAPGLTLLLGPNGCGKSTLLRLAAGVEIPDDGRVSVGGFDLWKEEVAARKNIAYLPEHPDLTPYASIKEILNLVCRLRGERVERGQETLTFFGLRQVAHRNVRELSLGQRRRAVFAACLIGKPDCLLLDEPLEGMDIGAQRTILAWIARRLEEGACVVIVSHTVRLFLDNVSRALTVRNGLVRLFTDLPAEAAQRKTMLENLAQGLDPA